MIRRARDLLRAYFAAQLLLLIIAVSFAAGILFGAYMGVAMIRTAAGG